MLGNCSWLVFLAGVDRSKYKDAIDELNNDYMRHGKPYPADVHLMMTWLTKRRGNGSSSKKEDDNADGVTSFAQIKQKTRVTCRGCGEKGHYGWECPNISAQERARIRTASNRHRPSDGSVSSNGSYRSDSQSSLDSRSSGNASQNDGKSGQRAPSPPRGR